MIDGFAKEDNPCIIIIPSVMRNNFPYTGIKPAVLMLDDEYLTEEIN